MPPAVVTAYVTRAELSLANLQLNDPGTYKPRAEPPPTAGTVTWRRVLASSPFAEGSYEVGAVRDQVSGGQLVIDAYATTHATLQTRVTTLLNAFRQSTYELHVTLDGTDWAWKCMRADYHVGVVGDEAIFGLFVPVALTFPRFPLAVAGSY